VGPPVTRRAMRSCLEAVVAIFIGQELRLSVDCDRSILAPTMNYDRRSSRSSIVGTDVGLWSLGPDNQY